VSGIAELREVTALLSTITTVVRVAASAGAMTAEAPATERAETAATAIARTIRVAFMYFSLLSKHRVNPMLGFITLCRFSYEKHRDFSFFHFDTIPLHMSRW
jgi:hypothetical protein